MIGELTFKKLLISSFIIACLTLSGLSFAKETLNCVILLDRSGSMEDTDPDGLSLPATVFLAEQLYINSRKNNIAIIPFSNTPWVFGYRDPSKAKLVPVRVKYIWQLLSNSESLKVQKGGDTNLYEALELAAKLLSEQEGRKIIILITDGEPDPHISKSNIDKIREICKLGDNIGINDIIKLKKSGELKKRYGDYIKKVYSKELAKAGIEIYPIAFIEFWKEGKKQETEEFLSSLKKATTGDKEIVVATREDLIDKLMSFFSLNDYRYVKIKPEAISYGNKNEVSWSIKLPSISNKVRFVIYYKEPPKEKINLSLFLENRKLFDSSENYSAPGVTRIPARDKRGSLVFDSILITSKNIAYGDFLLKLSSKNNIPEAAVFVDINADVFPEFELNPLQPSAEDTTYISFSLVHNRKKLELKDVKILASSIEQMITEEPQEYLPPKDNSIAAKFIFELQGKYRLLTKYRFRPADVSYFLEGSCIKEIIVGPPLPLVGNVWISIGSFSRKEEPINLPELGEETRVSQRLMVMTRLNREINGLYLEVSPVCIDGTDQCLETAGRKWVYVRPQEVIGLTKNRPFKFDLIAEIPDSFISPELKDGVYKGCLRLYKGEEKIDECSIKIKVKVPRLVCSKSEIESPLKSYRFERTIYYPGDIKHYFYIPVWSTTLSGTKAKVSIYEKEGIELINGKEDGREKYILFGVERDIIEIPGKQSSKPGYISAYVKVLDSSLNGKDYKNTILVSAGRHREMKIDLIAHVRFIPKSWRWLALILLIPAMFLLNIGLQTLINRKLWIGKKLRFPIIYGMEEEWSVKMGKYEILRIHYNGGSINTSENNFLQIYSDSGMYINESAEIRNQYYPAEGDSIKLLTPRGPFVLHVKMPTLAEPEFCLHVIRSPFGKGLRTFFSLIALCLFAVCILFVADFYTAIGFIGKTFGF